MSTCTSYIPMHTYIADMRTKEVSKCTILNEAFLVSRDYQWLSNLQPIPLVHVSVVWGLSVVDGIGGNKSFSGVPVNTYVPIFRDLDVRGGRKLRRHTHGTTTVTLAARRGLIINAICDFWCWSIKLSFHTIVFTQYMQICSNITIHFSQIVPRVCTSVLFLFK